MARRSVRTIIRRTQADAIADEKAAKAKAKKAPPKKEPEPEAAEG